MRRPFGDARRHKAVQKYDLPYVLYYRYLGDAEEGYIILEDGPYASPRPMTVRTAAERRGFAIGLQSIPPALPGVSGVGKPQNPAPRGPNDTRDLGARRGPLFAPSLTIPGDVTATDKKGARACWRTRRVARSSRRSRTG